MMKPWDVILNLPATFNEVLIPSHEHEQDSCMYWVVSSVTLYVLGGNMSGTRVCIGCYRAELCIGWRHERDLCMYWVVT